MNNNKMVLKISAISENEHFARTVVGCFVLRLNPSVAQVSDIKTAVSEAVTNCIVHGYPNTTGEITIEAYIENGNIHINIFDSGKGIENLDCALEPFFTTRADEERSGMGFTIMKSFMDSVHVESELGKGTRVYMSKLLKPDRQGA